MTSTDSSLPDQTRRFIYALLIVASVSIAVSRIASVSAQHGRTPFLSANDRSRIATVRALVDHGTYAIDKVIYEMDGDKIRHDSEGAPVRNRDWHTIDMVRHPDRDGIMRSYSSKPTLLPTLIAGEYWLVKNLTGETIGERPFYIGRILIVLTNILPMVLYLIVMAHLIEDWGTTNWGRLFAMTFATLGTFILTFAVTINNHLPATFSAAIAVLAALKIWYDFDHRWFWFALAGVFSAFTAANELPALSFFCMLAFALLLRAPLKTIFVFVPAAAIVVAASLGTNYLAHDSWRPPYAHRSDGDIIASVEANGIAASLDQCQVPTEITSAIASQHGQEEITDEAEIIVEQAGKRWQLSDRAEARRFALVRTDEQIEIRTWDDWYQFKGAYWRSGSETTIDLGEASPLMYAMHCTLGHHGIFSLTPIWLLAVCGLMWLIGSSQSEMRSFAIFVAVAALVVMGFYLSRGQVDRTYGGFTCGLRWMFWFTPMFLLMLLPAADFLARRRWGRCLAMALLCISIFSVFYAGGNPWTHPWLYNYWVYIEWVQP